MDSDLRNLDKALAVLEKKAIRTSQGDYVKLEDVRRLMAEEDTASEISKAEDEDHPKPKNMTAAKHAILKDPEIMKNFPPSGRPRMGKAIAASEPRSSSRT